MNSRVARLLLLLLLPFVAVAQDAEDHSQTRTGQAQAGEMDHSQMPGMHMESGAGSSSSGLAQEILRHDISGTDVQPNSTPTNMLMTMKAGWMLMFHANAFVVNTQQSSTRGNDRFFSTNWFMFMAQRKAGLGTLTLRSMLSLEPATVTGRRYPLLFQQGETAYGRPIADGQHPHDLFMELAALYDVKLGDKALLSLYAAPVGDPALGPVAYPHRASASEDPVATLGHHQQDSTHIAADVVTGGFTYGFARIEASGFHGREPDEQRWDINQGPIDSWSARVTMQPGKNWTAQYSYGRINSPEALSPEEDQERMAASVMYNLPFHGGNWASTLAWGRTRSLPDNSIFNSYLAESTIRFRSRNFVWMRIENVDRSSELLLEGGPMPAGFEERPIGRVQAYTAGFDHDFKVVPHIATALGAQITTYGVPESLKGIYGSHPLSSIVFLRFRPWGEEKK